MLISIQRLIPLQQTDRVQRQTMWHNYCTELSPPSFPFPQYCPQISRNCLSWRWQSYPSNYLILFKANFSLFHCKGSRNQFLLKILMRALPFCQASNTVLSGLRFRSLALLQPITAFSLLFRASAVSTGFAEKQK